MSYSGSGFRPRVLIAATSYTPELRSAALRPARWPRTEYVELAKTLDCEILDYSIYDSPRVWDLYRAVEKKTRLDFHLALRTYRMARQFDAVLLMSEMVVLPYIMLQKAFGRRAAVVYVSAHASHRQAKLVRRLRLSDQVDIAVGNWRRQQQFLSRCMLIPEERFRTVLYAVDETFYTPSGHGRGDYVFSSGIANRDYGTLFEAVEPLGLPTRVAIAGRAYSLGSQKVPPTPGNVELLPPTDSVGMVERYGRALVVVVPVMAPAGSSVILEGMCCGRPVIASDIEGVSDYVDHGRTGIIVTPSDPAALRDAIARVASDPELARELGENGRREVETRLSFDRLVEGLRSAVIDAVHGGAAASVHG